jgi:hypothetical protein
MGLLEDAIREHLELKRLRGADPAEVAREQREALEPPTGDAPTALVENHAGVSEDGTDTDSHEPAAEQRADEVPQPSPASEPSHASQETAELDMNSLMAEETSIGDEVAPPEGSHIPEETGDSSALAPDEDSLEWEVPARAHDAEAESELQDTQNLDEVAGERDVADGPDDRGKEGRPERQERGPGQGRLSL